MVSADVMNLDCKPQNGGHRALRDILRRHSQGGVEGCLVRLANIESGSLSPEKENVDCCTPDSVGLPLGQRDWMAQKAACRESLAG